MVHAVRVFLLSIILFGSLTGIPKAVELDTDAGLRTFIETSVLSGLPDPVGDFVAVIQNSPQITRTGLILWLNRKMSDAATQGDWTRHDRYLAFYTCVAQNNCDELSNMQSISVSLPNGAYDSDEEQVIFNCQGYGRDQCIGTYAGTGDKEPAKIVGTFHRDGWLDGIWVETKSAQACQAANRGSRHWGKVNFRFAPDANSWTGIWGYCENDPDPKRAWDGWR